MLKFLILLTLTITPFISLAQACDKLLGQPATYQLHQRLSAYINHQTEVRRKKGLDTPLIDIEKALKKAPKKISPDKPLVLGKPISPIYFINDRYLVPRPKTDDADLLNYVYEFDGNSLLQAIPALKYFIGLIDADIIHITRSMSYEEWILWNATGVEGLRKSKPRNNWGYLQPKLHFALGQYSYLRRPYSLTFSIPKSTLLKWGRKNQVSIGMEHWSSQSQSIEIVVLDGVWEELITYKN